MRLKNAVNPASTLISRRQTASKVIVFFIIYHSLYFSIYFTIFILILQQKILKYRLLITGCAQYNMYSTPMNYPFSDHEWETNYTIYEANKIAEIGS